MVPRPSSRLRPSGEDGFGIIEVLVSALIVVIISLGVLAAVDAAGRTASTNKSRSAASSLATADQERLRSIPISTLTDLDSTSSTTVDATTYSVRSQGSYVVGSGDSTDCGSSEAAPKYLKIVSTVTWPNMKVAPVVQNSLRAMPNGTVAGRGSLAVDIDDRAGAGVSGISVTATGPQTVSGTTNASGCVIFGFLPAGSYTIAFSRSGYVEAKSPYRQNISDPAVVAVDAIASASYQYDQAGSAGVNYVTNNAYLGTTWTTAIPGGGSEFTIANSLMGTPGTRSFGPHTGAAASPAFGGNFPYTSAYEAWSGSCVANRPTYTPSVGTLTVPRGGTGTATVREFRVRVQVQRRTTSAGGNYATMPSANSVVKFYSAGCTVATTAAFVSNTGSATGTSTASANYSTYEAIVPWGTYSVCAQYANGTSNRARNNSVTDASTGPTTQNNTFGTGVTYPTRIEVPFNQTTNYACP